MSKLRVDQLSPTNDSRTIDVESLLESGTATPSDIAMPQGGDLSQVINYVTPELFGAIGDGTAHPLSERYTTLASAQAIYPFVTALTQTIDWAACQAADNYARGKTVVRCPSYANYHFGSSDYLEIAINSKWYGNSSPQNDSACTTITRTNPPTSPAFGQDCIVRVKNASAAGSADEFVRGVVFDGFKLTRGVARRSATKGTGRIGLHLNMGMKAHINVSIAGCEYGLYGYVCWGLTGFCRIDSCHKGIWLDAATTTPEYTAASGAALTSIDLRVEVDTTPFGITLRRCKYSKFSGFIEGVIASGTYANYDYSNETAVAITCYGCDSIDFNHMGIEAWQGVHAYINSSSVSVNMSWTQDYLLLNTTGKHGPYQAMSALTSATELFTLPATNNSYYYAQNSGFLTLRNMTGDMSSSDFTNTFLITTDSTSRFCMDNCAIYFGSSRLIHPLNGYWSNISFVNDRFFKDYMVPSGYTWIGSGRCQTTAWTLGSIGATGQVSLTAPSGWNLVDFEAYANVGSSTQAGSTAIIGVSGAPTTSGVTLQTNFTGTAGTYSVYYKLTLAIAK